MPGPGPGWLGTAKGSASVHNIAHDPAHQTAVTSDPAPSKPDTSATPRPMSWPIPRARPDPSQLRMADDTAAHTIAHDPAHATAAAAEPAPSKQDISTTPRRASWPTSQPRPDPGRPGTPNVTSAHKDPAHTTGVTSEPSPPTPERDAAIGHSPTLLGKTPPPEPSERYAATGGPLAHRGETQSKLPGRNLVARPPRILPAEPPSVVAGRGKVFTPAPTPQADTPPAPAKPGAPSENLPILQNERPSDPSRRDPVRRPLRTAHGEAPFEPSEAGAAVGGASSGGGGSGAVRRRASMWGAPNRDGAAGAGGRSFGAQTGRAGRLTPAQNHRANGGHR